MGPKSGFRRRSRDPAQILWEILKVWLCDFADGGNIEHRGRAMPDFLDVLFYIIAAGVAVVIGGSAVGVAIQAWRDWSYTNPRSA